MIADFVTGDFVADLCNHSGNLMTRNHRELRTTPFIAGLMNIRMTNSAILDVDRDIVFAGIATFESVGDKGGFGFKGGVGTCRCHGSIFLC
jgi:hypothetical protein